MIDFAISNTPCITSATVAVAGAGGFLLPKTIGMKTQHIIIDANILVKFPQTENFFKAAGEYYDGVNSYIRSHSIPRSDSWFMLELLQKKGTDIIVFSKMGKARAVQVMNAHRMPFSQAIDSLDSLTLNPSDCLVVTMTTVEATSARQSGFRTIQFREGHPEIQYEILAAAGLVKKSESSQHDGKTFFGF